MPDPTQIIDRINGQPEIKGVPKKPDKTWSSWFLYLMIAYAIFCTWKMYIRKEDTVSAELYNNCQRDLKEAQAFIWEMVPKTEHQKQITRETAEDVAQKVDSVNNVTAPAIQEYNSSFKKISKYAK